MTFFFAFQFLGGGGPGLDHSELGNADADCNVLVNNRRTICAYYNERSFNESYKHILIIIKKNIITKLFI